MTSALVWLHAADLRIPNIPSTTYPNVEVRDVHVESIAGTHGAWMAAAAFAAAVGVQAAPMTNVELTMELAAKGAL